MFMKEKLKRQEGNISSAPHGEKCHWARMALVRACLCADRQHVG
jgi:hypothetical protein